MSDRNESRSELLEQLASAQRLDWVPVDQADRVFASLAEGTLDGEQVESPLHGSVFNVATGEVIDPRRTKLAGCFKCALMARTFWPGPLAG